MVAQGNYFISLCNGTIIKPYYGIRTVRGGRRRAREFQTMLEEIYEMLMQEGIYEMVWSSV